MHYLLRYYVHNDDRAYVHTTDLHVLPTYDKL